MHLKIDRKSPEIMAAIAAAPIYKKRGTVQARPAVAGERLETTLASGASETANTANAGDYVVTNPSGEQYIISSAKFEARYEPTNNAGVYAAKGHCRAIRNPFGKPIEILASWGEPQYGDEQCLLADVCDEIGNLEGEPYIIEGKAFAETYADHVLT